MSDRFSLQPNCSACGTNLENKEHLMLMAPGEFIDLTCPKCGTAWRFWIEVKTNQKKIGIKNRVLSNKKSGF